jgi:hypothetical protein
LAVTGLCGLPVCLLLPVARLRLLAVGIGRRLPVALGGLWGLSVGRLTVTGLLLLAVALWRLPIPLLWSRRGRLSIARLLLLAVALWRLPIPLLRSRRGRLSIARLLLLAVALWRLPISLLRSGR